MEAPTRTFKRTSVMRVAFEEQLIAEVNSVKFHKTLASSFDERQGFLYFHLMMKRLFPLFFLLAACGSGEKTPFCQCMEAGDELNSYSANILDTDEIDDEVESKMKELKSTKEKLCKDYEMMGGAEMLKLREDCSEMNAKDEALDIVEK